MKTLDFLVRHEASDPDCIAGVETRVVAREALGTRQRTGRSANVGAGVSRPWWARTTRRKDVTDVLLSRDEPAELNR